MQPVEPHVALAASTIQALRYAATLEVRTRSLVEEVRGTLFELFSMLTVDAVIHVEAPPVVSVLMLRFRSMLLAASRQCANPCAQPSERMKSGLVNILLKLTDAQSVHVSSHSCKQVT